MKPISYMKANAARIVDELANGGEPVVITRNGEAKAVVLSLDEYERTRETLALLRILALARRNAEDGRTKPAGEVLERLRRKVAGG